MKIADYKLHRLRLPLQPPIGDSQVFFDEHWISVLELLTDDGLTGVGFQLRQGMPTPSLAEQIAQFKFGHWKELKGANPFGVGMRISRPRGGNVGAGEFSLAIETAVWDLMAKAVHLPLYRLLGGTDPKVRAYGSTLDFHLSDADFRQRLGDFQNMGFRAVKTKVGHPDIAWDLRRLGIVLEVFGPDVDLMIDANEAWSPKEALRRANVFHNEGFEVFWIEDPITRDDHAGYAKLCSQIPFARINTGEYLGFGGKRRLLEAHAVDVLNVHGSIAMSRAAAYLAGDYGIPVSLGNTLLEIGVHLAASLPECLYLEYSDLSWNQLAKDPVRFEAGYAFAPDCPGHGIELNYDAIERFSCPS